VEEQERTLIVVRRVATELKTALAGKIPEVFARSKALMASFRSASRSLGRWELAFMVESGGHERAVQREGHEDVSGARKDERQFFRDASCRQTRLVKRIAFAAVAFNVEGTCDRRALPIAQNLIPSLSYRELVYSFR